MVSMNHSIKIQEDDYRQLKLIAEKTHRTISGTISYLLETSGMWESTENPNITK